MFKQFPNWRFGSALIRSKIERSALGKKTQERAKKTINDETNTARFHANYFDVFRPSPVGPNHSPSIVITPRFVAFLSLGPFLLESIIFQSGAGSPMPIYDLIRSVAPGAYN